MGPSGPWPRTGGGRRAAGGNRTQTRAKAARTLKNVPLKSHLPGAKESANIYTTTGFGPRKNKKMAVAYNFLVEKCKTDHVASCHVYRHQTLAL